LNIKQLITFFFTLGTGVMQAQPAYWQQKVDNDIAVTLDDKENMLRGNITIVYQNNSPDTLRFIYFHLYPNAYSTDRTAFERQAVENKKTDHYFSGIEDRGFIDSLKFTVTGSDNSIRPAGIVEMQDPDIMRLILPEPLLPGGRISMETPFRIKIPKAFSRLGHDKQTYQISQWFPKPAVYDAKGWHAMPYLDQGEFYSEYGSYHVEITLPENYIVMGTGNIMEQKENDWLDALSKLPLPKAKDTTVIVSAQQLKTITFEEENIHDFAWFANKKWIVRKDTVQVPGSDHVVTAYACYSPSGQKEWAQSLTYIKKAVRAYSEAVGPYPYQTVKAVEGPIGVGGGMEYPTITVIAATKDSGLLQTCLVHEVGHNWFYGILGSNERMYPWMDESINNFYEQKIAPYHSTIAGINRDESFFAYAAMAATNNLVPADTSAMVMSEASYGADIYGKASAMFFWLEAYMGKENFTAAMKEYFNTWQYKHPQPADFRVIFEKHSSKSLSWFFDEAMRSTRPVDFAIGSVKKKNGLEVTVHNKTGMKTPAQVIVYQHDGKDSVSMWTEPFTGTTTISHPSLTGYEKVKIADAVPDYNIRNNENRSPLTLNVFAGFNMDPKMKVWVLPAIGYNYYDGFMAGAMLHNLTTPQNKFQFAVVPFYAFGSKTFAGTGIAGYTFNFHDGWLHDIQLNVSGKTFSYGKTNMNIENYIHTRFTKVAPELVFNIRKPDWRSPVSRSLSIKGYWIREDVLQYNQNPVDSLYRPSKGGYEDNFYGKLRYEHKNERTFNPFSYALEGQLGKQFAKLSVEANLRVDYFQKNKALHIRAYAGKFFSFGDNSFDAYRYRIANTYSGQNDYLYDETYFGRNEQTGFWSQQISIKEGGFKVNTLQYATQLGLTDNWLFSLNLKTDIPYLWNLPVRLFADVATFADAKRLNPSGASVLYEAGIEVYWGEYVSVYLPLVMSKDFSEYTKSIYPENRFLKTISFSVNIGNLNWLKSTRKILRM
jgi:hypothetical protein